jgi:hypothetical protein
VVGPGSGRRRALLGRRLPLVSTSQVTHSASAHARTHANQRKRAGWRREEGRGGDGEGRTEGARGIG